MQELQLILPVSRHFYCENALQRWYTCVKEWEQTLSPEPFSCFICFILRQPRLRQLSQWEMEIYKTFEEAIENPPPSLQKPTIYFFLLFLLIFLMSTRIPINATKLQSLATSKVASLSFLCRSLRCEQKQRTGKGSFTINYSKSTVHSDRYASTHRMQNYNKTVPRNYFPKLIFGHTTCT